MHALLGRFGALNPELCQYLEPHEIEHPESSDAHVRGTEGEVAVCWPALPHALLCHPVEVQGVGHGLKDEHRHKQPDKVQQGASSSRVGSVPQLRGVRVERHDRAGDVQRRIEQVSQVCADVVFSCRQPLNLLVRLGRQPSLMRQYSTSQPPRVQAPGGI